MVHILPFYKVASYCLLPSENLPLADNGYDYHGEITPWDIALPRKMPGSR